MSAEEIRAALAPLARKLARAEQASDCQRVDSMRAKGIVIVATAARPSVKLAPVIRLTAVRATDARTGLPIVVRARVARA